MLFFSSLSGCWVFSNLVIFHQIKVAKQIWEPCCHLAAETDSWFPLIVHIPSAKLAPIDRNQGILKGEVSLYCWPPVWLIWNQLYDYCDSFCFYLRNRLIQTSQTGGQQYSDTSLFSIPCRNIICPDISTNLFYYYILANWTTDFQSNDIVSFYKQHLLL